MIKVALFTCALTAMAVLNSGAIAADVQDGVTHISQAEFQDKVSSGDGSIVIDVRTEQEYLDGHIPGAINIPHSQLIKNVSLIDKYRSKDIVFYCRTGVRVSYVTEYLNKIDYGDEHSLYHLKGDKRAWRAAQLPIEK